MPAKQLSWLYVCRELALDDFAFDDSHATLFVPVVGVETLLGLGEDLDDTAETVVEGVRDLLSEKLGQVAHDVKVDPRVSGDSLGLAISVDPSTFSDDAFSQLAANLIEHLGEYLG